MNQIIVMSFLFTIFCNSQDNKEEKLIPIPKNIKLSNIYNFTNIEKYIQTDSPKYCFFKLLEQHKPYYKKEISYLYYDYEQRNIKKLFIEKEMTPILFLVDGFLYLDNSTNVVYNKNIKNNKIQEYNDRSNIIKLIQKSKKFVANSKMSKFIYSRISGENIDVFFKDDKNNYSIFKKENDGLPIDFFFVDSVTLLIANKIESYLEQDFDLLTDMYFFDIKKLSLKKFNFNADDLIRNINSVFRLCNSFGIYANGLYGKNYKIHFDNKLQMITKKHKYIKDSGLFNVFSKRNMEIFTISQSKKIISYTEVK